MKRTFFLGTMLGLAGSLLAAGAGPKDEVNDAAKKLAAQPNYSWKTSMEAGGAGGGGGGGGGGRGRFGGGPTEGKTEKDGFTMLSMTRGENTMEAVLKSGKGAIKTQEGWKSLAEATEGDGGGGGGGAAGRGNPGRLMARVLQNFKAPASQAEDLIAKSKDIKKAEDAYTADLTEEGVKELLAFGPRRGGGDGPAVSNAKGTAKFWVKDGVLSKYEFKVQGTMSFNGNDREISRTTTVEIKDVGSTKVTVPDEAKKKIS